MLRCSILFICSFFCSVISKKSLVNISISALYSSPISNS
ncbi:hypothetical protein SAMD00023520_02163 [Listeria monocytogenes]|nr:hypothetical protein SAMD00023520_02163 [Listeria monocytogenes]